MTALGRRADAPEPGDALVDVAATIAQSLALPYVEIELAGGAEPAAWGRPVPTTVALDLCHRGERVGTLRVAPHVVGGTVSAIERRLLADLARQVAVTAHVVQLSQGLQRSREALVATREEERRRLRRDLHDGLGPTLAAMTLRIDVALRLLEREPAAVEDLLLGLRDESQRAIADIRRVAYGLRPPALDELGLHRRDRASAPSGSLAPLDVDLDLPDTVPALPAAIEVAALRIVQEALANVAHHSGARACGVRLEVAHRGRDRGLRRRRRPARWTTARASACTRCASAPPSSAGRARSSRAGRAGRACSRSSRSPCAESPPKSGLLPHDGGSPGAVQSMP